jgi:hypothetical protein
MKNMCICTHTSDCVETVYELPLLPNNSASETCLHQSGAVRRVDWIFYSLDAGLAVIVRLRDIGHNVLQSFF